MTSLDVPLGVDQRSHPSRGLRIAAPLVDPDRTLAVRLDLDGLLREDPVVVLLDEIARCRVTHPSPAVPLERGLEPRLRHVFLGHPDEIRGIRRMVVELDVVVRDLQRDRLRVHSVPDFRVQRPGGVRVVARHTLSVFAAVVGLRELRHPRRPEFAPRGTDRVQVVDPHPIVLDIDRRVLDVRQAVEAPTVGSRVRTAAVGLRLIEPRLLHLREELGERDTGFGRDRCRDGRGSRIRDHRGRSDHDVVVAAIVDAVIAANEAGKEEKREGKERETGHQCTGLRFAARDRTDRASYHDFSSLSTESPSNRVQYANMTPWTAEESLILKKLSTPSKIQDFVNALRFRIVGTNETCHSPRMVLRGREAQCVEGAIFAAAALRFHGYQALIVDLVSTNQDQDHVIAVFQINGSWGAISKTNHGVLRYREPVYRSIRELTMSYFHEYFLQSNRKKTLRSFSKPVNLARFDKREWETSEEPIWYIPEYLTTIPHTPILNRSQIAKLRIADPIEAKMTETVEWEQTERIL